MSLALVAVPLTLLFAVILLPSIPKIGGDVRVGLLVAGLAAALLGGLGARDILRAGADGLDMLSWVIMLSIFGSIYAESQVRLGAVDTTLDTFRSIFGHSPRGLIAAVIATLVLAGSLLGDAIAAATVIGFLVIRSLYDLDLSGERIGAIIVMGAVIGSGMPPITQAFLLSSSLVGAEPEAVFPWAYGLVGVSVVVAILTGATFVRKRNARLPGQLMPSGSTLHILRTRWYTLIPLMVLVAIVIAASVFDYDIFARWAPLAAFSNLVESVPILQGLAFPVVMAIIVATLFSLLFPRVAKEGRQVVTGGLRKVSKTVQIQLCAGFMVGAFYQAGLIDAVKGLTEGSAATALKLGGGGATILVGMLTGSQTTAQSTIITFLGPVLVDGGVPPVNAAVGSALLAMAGQSFPPVGLTTFVVAGIVGGILSTKVDPVKIMLLILPVSAYFALAGFLAWFV